MTTIEHDDHVVMLVEDDHAVREAIAELLEDNEYRTVEVANGQEALDRLRGGTRPCLILLDIMMPVMDGREFHATISGDPALRSIPVVILTAHATAEEARAMGVNDYLRKPVRATTLLQTVGRWCKPGAPTAS